MKYFLFVILILGLCHITPALSSTPGPTPSIKSFMELTISAEEIKKDSAGNIISVKVKAVLKNISNKKVTIDVSECNPDHFYDASINGGEYFPPIEIIHCVYCGTEKTFKPGEGITDVIEITSKIAIKKIRFRYPIHNKYIESNELTL
jgi:hypothetical protein